MHKPFLAHADTKQNQTVTQKQEPRLPKHLHIQLVPLPKQEKKKSKAHPEVCHKLPNESLFLMETVWLKPPCWKYAIKDRKKSNRYPQRKNVPFSPDSWELIPKQENPGVIIELRDLWYIFPINKLFSGLLSCLLLLPQTWPRFSLIFTAFVSSGICVPETLHLPQNNQFKWRGGGCVCVWIPLLTNLSYNLSEKKFCIFWEKKKKPPKKKKTRKTQTKQNKAHKKPHIKIIVSLKVFFRLLKNFDYF